MSASKTVMKIATWLASVIFMIAVGVLLTAQILISTDEPTKESGLVGDSRFNFASLTPPNLAGLPTIRNFQARDQTLLGYRFYGSSKDTPIKLYLLHSAGWQGMEFNTLANALAYQDGIADVFVPDLRGQGGSPAHRGNADYTGQLEDDLADLIKATAQKGDIIIIGGHSEGGGLAARFAAGPYSKLVKGTILLAPVISLSFPASRPDLGGWVKPLKKRLLGLSILHAGGLHWSDHETAIQYAIPSPLRDGPLGYTVTTGYSWTLMRAMQTREADGSDFKKLQTPLLVIAGSDDSVIFPGKLKDSIGKFTNHGEYEIISGENHLGVVNSPKTLTIIQNWMAKLR